MYLQPDLEVFWQISVLTTITQKNLDVLDTFYWCKTAIWVWTETMAESIYCFWVWVNLLLSGMDQYIAFGYGSIYCFWVWVNIMLLGMGQYTAFGLGSFSWVLIHHSQCIRCLWPITLTMLVENDARISCMHELKMVEVAAQTQYRHA